MTTKTLAERFRERFAGYWRGEAIPDEILSFFLTEQREVLERLKGEDKVLPKRFDCPDCIELMKELDRDDVCCAICNGERGYNCAVADHNAKIEEEIKLLGNK